jgi:hypothetical protein
MAETDQTTTTLKKLRRQLEFYFGESNFRKDNFMRDTAAQDDGYISIETLLTFPRLKAISTDPEAICTSIADSPVVEHDDEKTKLRRKEPLPEVDTSNERTVYVKGLSRTATLDELLDFFEGFGQVNAVRMRRLRDKTFRGSVLVEFFSKEEGQAFIDNSNNMEASSSSVSFKGTPLAQVCWLADWEQEKKDEDNNRKEMEEDRTLQASERNVFFALSYQPNATDEEEKGGEEDNKAFTLSFGHVKDSLNAFIDANCEEKGENFPAVKFIDLNLDIPAIFPDLATETSHNNGEEKGSSWFMVRCKSPTQRNTLFNLLKSAFENEGNAASLPLEHFAMTGVRLLEGENETNYLRLMLRSKRGNDNSNNNRQFKKNKRSRR